MTSKSLPMKKNKGEDFDVKYGHILQVLTDWIDTTVLVMNAGRGMAKSTVIQARRAYRCVMEMPGGASAFCSNTYTNLEQNIMPAVQNGWKLMGLIEGVHYVKGQRPPDKWRSRCSVIIDDYRYVYSFFNGSVIFLGSLDHPSLLAGKSVLHLFFDEAKYAKDESVKRALPILRGDAISFGLAPSILVYSILMQYASASAFIVPVSFIYALCGVMRLVKFNIITVASNEKGDFSGMPIPNAAAMVCSYYLICYYLQKNFDRYCPSRIHYSCNHRPTTA